MFITDLQVSQFFMSILQHILKSVVLHGFSFHMLNTNSLGGGGYMFVTDLQVSQFFMRGGGGICLLLTSRSLSSL